MPSDRAIAIRDELNKIVDGLIPERDDQEANVLACCVALAIEEIEKWMYNGDFTPSVAPFREGIEWEYPEAPGPLNPQTHPSVWFGVDLAHVDKDEPEEDLKADLTRFTTFQRLKASGKLDNAQNNPEPPRSALDAFEPADWDSDTMRAFRDANRGVFCVCVRQLIPNYTIALKEALDYCSKMQKAYPHIWGANKVKT